MSLVVAPVNAFAAPAALPAENRLPNKLDSFGALLVRSFAVFCFADGADVAPFLPPRPRAGISEVVEEINTNELFCDIVSAIHKERNLKYLFYQRHLSAHNVFALDVFSAFGADVVAHRLVDSVIAHVLDDILQNRKIAVF